MPVEGDGLFLTQFSMITTLTCLCMVFMFLLFFPSRPYFGGTSFPSSKVLQMMGRAKSNFCSKTKTLSKLKQR